MFDVGPHISFTKDTRIQDAVRRQRRPAVRNDPDQPEQLLARPLAAASGAAAPARIAGGHRRQGDRGFRGGASRARAADQQLRRLALASFGRTFAEAFPMQYTRKYHTTTAENMSTDWLGPRIYRPSLEEVLRGALSSVGAALALHHPLPLPERGRVHVLSEEVRADGQPEAAARADRRSILGSRQLTFANGARHPVRRAGLVGAAAGSDSNDQGRAAGGRGRVAAAGLLDVRARQHRRQPRGPLAGAHDVLLRRGHLLHAARLSAHALAAQRAAGNRQHSGGSLLLGQVQAVHRFAGRLDRAGHPGSSPLRHAARRRSRSCRRKRCCCGTPT